MLRLLLLRHAKAQPATGTSDAARPLTAGGRRQAAEVGRKLAGSGAPDFILCSPARRTRETLEGIVPFLAPAPPTSFVEGLYAGNHDDYREIVVEQGGLAETLLVVGHNPAIRDLALDLVDPSDADRVARFPVATLAAIIFPAERWKTIRRGSGQLASLTFAEPPDGQ